MKFLRVAERCRWNVPLELREGTGEASLTEATKRIVGGAIFVMLEAW
ncbi:hypothetical protein [Lysinibacter sp. HNR]|nr:hypothetical protein [Lysinibacter sp. HNR]WGD37541.1 hypothetical protein FrondiHNR_01045 [Lysinibacter sp. HNR]